MQQTTHYQLNQWEPEDRILRTDFNSDNARVDAALAGLKAASLMEKVLDVTTAEGANLVEVDVSGIDFTQYRQVDVYIRVKMATYTNISFYLNEALTKEYYTLSMTGSGSSSYSNSSNLASMGGWRADTSVTADVHLNFGTPCAGNPIQCITNHAAVGANYVDTNIYRRSSTSVKWDTLRKLIFQASSESAVIPAGTNVVIMGVKR